MNWIVVVFFVVMTFSLAIPRHRALQQALLKDAGFSSTITHSHGPELFSAYFALPEGGRAPYPAILLIHDKWGLTKEMKQHARRLALSSDYVVMAVDLFRSETTRSPERAQELTAELRSRPVVKSLVSALAALRAREEVDPQRIGVMGWGTGAEYALALTIQDPEIRAVVLCGDLPSTKPEELRQLKAPLLGIFGGEDPNVPVTHVRQFERLLRELRKEVAVVIYPSAGHDFMNPEIPGEYRDADARDAWIRLESFLLRALAK